MRQFSALLCAVLFSSQLAISQEQRPEWMIGKTFYACHNTPIFAYGLSGGKWRGTFEIPAVPLVPLHITDARFQDDDGKVTSILLLLETESGSRALVSIVRDIPKVELSEKRFDLIASHYLNGYDEIPKGWVKHTVYRISDREVEVGMTKLQVYCSLGFPDHENDYGRGDTQAVYNDGALMVYYDAEDIVRNVQRFR